MSSSRPTTQSENIKKRKAPPTFQHLPDHKAKQLKKAWVEKTKIKSKWKAEKRKLNEQGVLTKMPWELYEEDLEANKVGEREWGGIGSRSGSDDEGKPNPPKRARKHKEKEEEEQKEEEPVAPRPPRIWGTRQLPVSPNPESKPHQKGKESANREPPTKEGEEESREPTLRDLKREAYSRSTLHSFKADPLHKNGHRNDPTRGRLANRGAGAGARGRGRGGFVPRGGGRGGQPNMKLRMDVMLEKIKRDYAPN